MTYIPAQEVSYEQKDILTVIMRELRKANLHLQSMSGEEITEEDIDED